MPYAIWNKKYKKWLDVVEVVRCKDCAKFLYDESRDLWYCGAWGGLGGAERDDYCSYGERKDDKR